MESIEVHNQLDVFVSNEWYTKGIINIVYLLSIFLFIGVMLSMCDMIYSPIQLMQSRLHLQLFALFILLIWGMANASGILALANADFKIFALMVCLQGMEARIILS